MAVVPYVFATQPAGNVPARYLDVDFTTVGTFSPTWTDAVPRSVSDKLMDIESVKDFGAVGDGNVDDTTSWQDALNTGRSFWVPAGTYKTTGPLTVAPVDGQRIIGEGRGRAILQPTGDFDALTFTNGNEGGGISNLEIDASDMTGGRALVISNYFRITLEDLLISSPFNGLYVSQTHTTNLSRVRVTGIRGDYGLLWEGAGSTRSDIMNLSSCAFNSSNGNTTSDQIILDGNVHTLNMWAVQTQNGNRGLLVRNSVSGDLDPSGIEAFNFAANIQHGEGFRAEVGSGFHFFYFYANNPTSAADGFYTADGVVDVQVVTPNIDGIGHNGLNFNGQNHRVIGGLVEGCSTASGGTYSNFLIGPTASDIVVMGVETNSGVGPAAYGADIDALATKVQLIGNNLNGNVASLRDASGTALVVGPSAAKGTGMYVSGNGLLDFAIKGTDRFEMTDGARAKFHTSMLVGWATGLPTTAMDTAFDKISPAVVALGDGTLADVSGEIQLARTTLTGAVAPSAPSSGWTLYCDSGDSNKLKAIAANGTVITLGTP